MLAQFFLQFALASVLGVGMDDGYATVFGTPGDVHAGGNLACGNRPIPQDEPVCAHRWLPCGTEVTVINLERPSVSTCRIADRGPYGVDRWGRWRGVIDLTPHAARAAALDGRDLVRLFYFLPKPGHKAYQETTWLRPKRRSSPSM